MTRHHESSSWRALPSSRSAALATACLSLAAGMFARTARAQEATPRLTLGLTPATVVGGNPVTGTIGLGAPAPAGGTSVRLTTAAVAVAALVSPRLGPFSALTTMSVTVPEGQSTMTFQLRTFGVSTSLPVAITAATSTESASATLTVTPASVRAVSSPRGSVVGGAAATVAVSLDGAAPAGTGATVAIAVFEGSGSGPQLTGPPAASAPPTILIAPNATSGSVIVSTFPTSARRTVTVRATLGQSALGYVTVVPPSIATAQMSPAAVYSEQSAVGTVVLNGPAPSTGFLVNLQSGDATVAVPASVLIPSGADRATFAATARATTAFTTARIEATAGAAPTNTTVTDGTSNTVPVTEVVSSQTVTSLRVFPLPVLRSVAVDPVPVLGGSGVSVTLQLDAPTSFPVGPLPPPRTAELEVDRPDLVQLPTTVLVPVGRTSVAISGTTSAPNADQTVGLIAKLEGRNASATVQVRTPPPAIATFTIRPTTARGGGNLLASILLAPTVTVPTVVTFTTDRPDLVQLPSSLTFSPSSVAHGVTLGTSVVAASAPVSITAATGAQRVTVGVTLTP